MHELISALADIAWPIIFLGLLFYFRKEIAKLFTSGSEIAIEFMGSSLNSRSDTSW